MIQFPRRGDNETITLYQEHYAFGHAKWTDQTSPTWVWGGLVVEWPTKQRMHVWYGIGPGRLDRSHHQLLAMAAATDGDRHRPL